MTTSTTTCPRCVAIGKPGIRRGLCWSCYQSRRPKATCHPDRPVDSRGLCSPCYQRTQRWQHAERRYGLTEAGYNLLLEQQGGVCAICSQPPREGRSLAIDHDHRTGRFRGLLCDDCNRGLGMFRDSPAALVAAAAYLVERGAR